MKKQWYLPIAFIMGLVMISGCTERVVEKAVYVDRPVEVVKEVEVIKEVEVPVEVIKEVEKPVYMYDTVEVEKNVFVELLDWVTVDELEAFLLNDDTDSHIYLIADSDGVVQLNGQCEDIAIQLMDNAALVGKRLSFVPLSPDEYLKWYGTYPGNNVYHAICGALVGDNEFYYIEVDDDRYWLAINLD